MRSARRSTTPTSSGRLRRTASWSLTSSGGSSQATKVQARYQAELVPFTLNVGLDAETRKPIGRFDLTRFSSWAKQNQPAQITFGVDRRPEHMSLPMMLGTSVQIRLKTG